MDIDKIIITVMGGAGILATAWFFFGKKEKAVEAKEKIEIKVSGGYSPSAIIIPKGKTTTLSFYRTDPNECLEEVVIGDFKIKKRLPLNQRVDIEIKPENKGEYDFSCGMGMYHGKIIVK